MKLTQLNNKPLSYITSPIFNYSTLFFIYLSLLVLKGYGFIVTGNLLLLVEGITSLFGILAIVYFITSRNFRHQKFLTNILQGLFLSTGLLFLLLGLICVFEKQLTKEPEFAIIIVILSILLISLQYSYSWMSSILTDNIGLYVITKELRGKIFSSMLVIFTVVSEMINLFFFEGFFIIFFGFICFSKIREISLGRDTFHIHVMLAEKPYTHDEILNIDKRIAMIFGAPMFLSQDNEHDKVLRWRIELALLSLIKKGIIEEKGDRYHLTEQGKELANKEAGQMIRFFRFIQKLINPAISPIVSLFLHLFLGSLKIGGFFITGSIGLLGDGLDSAIDGVSSIVVGIAMKINREIEATYLLLALMTITGGSIIISSVERLLNPAPLIEGSLALVIAGISIILCLGLYLYQRYSGYHNRSLPILAQSEDSKNHVLNASLVIIAVIASFFGVYFLDGIVGCFIGFLILKGAWEIFQDLRNLNQGGTINYEKYKLGVWKFYSNFRLGMLDTWILHQISNGIMKQVDLINNFEVEFQPLKICTTDGDCFTFNYSYNQNTLLDHIKQLLIDDFIYEDSESYSLTELGENKVLKQKKRFRHKR